MARFDTSNFRADAKIYSVVGRDVTGATGKDVAVQVGQVGSIGKRVEDDVYEFLPPQAGDTDIFVIATPEVDPDESNVSKNSLHGFTLPKGAIVDAIELSKHAKFAIEGAGIVGTVVVNGYVYVKEGERKFQFKATKPAEADKACVIAVVEEIVDATQNMFLKVGSPTAKSLTNVALNYKLVRCRVL